LIIFFRKHANKLGILARNVFFNRKFKNGGIKQMGRSRETYNKKDVRKKKEKKRKDKLAKKMAKRDEDGNSGLDNMIAYVDEFGNITDKPKDPDEIEETNVEDIEVSIPKGSNVQASKERTGKIISFFDSKAYGFIRDDDTGDTVFVHVNNAHDDIGEGDKVSFETEKGEKGLAAVNVKVIK